MDNKEIARQFFENLFVNNDKAYEVLADDVRVDWPGFGMETLVGRDSLRKFMDDSGLDRVVDMQIRNLLAEGDTVIAAGSISTETAGKTERSHFADVYTVQNGKITALQSYMVFDKGNDKD